MIFYNLTNRFKKYAHFPSRLDEKETGWVPIKHYSWLIKKGIEPMPTEFGYYGSFSIYIKK